MAEPQAEGAEPIKFQSIGEAAEATATGHEAQDGVVREDTGIITAVSLCVSLPLATQHACRSHHSALTPHGPECPVWLDELCSMAAS